MLSRRAHLTAGTLAVLLSALAAGVAGPAPASAAHSVTADEGGGPTDLRVMTWNIHRGEPPGSTTPDLERIANVIRTENPDVVALNEVHQDEQQAPDGHGDQPAILAGLLADAGYAYRYYGVSEVHGSDHPGTRGELVLSKYRIYDDPGDPRRPEQTVLTTQNAHPGEPDRRSMVKVTLDVPGAGDVRVYATHLSPRASDAQIADHDAQVRTILNRDPADPDVITDFNQPVVLMGDMNLRPTAEAKPLFAERGFVDTWTVVNNSGDGPTRPGAYGRTDGSNPDKRIDHVYASPRFDVVDGHVSVVDQYASDHLAVVMDLRLRDVDLLESGSVLAGPTGAEGWAHLALDRLGRATLTVCKNAGTSEDDGSQVQARVYDPVRGTTYGTASDGGTSRDRCQTTTWYGFSPSDTTLQACMVSGDQVTDCRTHTLFARLRAGANGDAGTADVRIDADRRVRLRVCDDQPEGWGVAAQVYTADPATPVVEVRVADGGCATSERQPWSWDEPSLVARDCLYRDGMTDRACHTRVLAGRP